MRKGSTLTSCVLVLFLLLASGCIANRPALTCPGKGGPAWHEIRSSHFVVKTDQPPEDGKDMAVDLEMSRAALLAAMGAPPDDAAARVEVIAFERRVDFRAVLDRPFMGVFSSHIRGDVEVQPVIVLFGGLSHATRATLQHELTHQIVRRRTSNLPFWLDEGLAELFSTLRIDGDGTAIVGEPPYDVDFWEYEYSMSTLVAKGDKVLLPASRAPSLDELLAANRLTMSGEDVGVHYAAAWKLVHTLRGHVKEGYAPRFAAMLKALMSGTDGRAAFYTAYEDVHLPEIDAAYRKLLLDAREYPRIVGFDSNVDRRLQVSLLSDADVHAIWTRVATMNGGNGTSPEEQLGRGLDENPDALPLLYARAALNLNLKEKAELRDDIKVLLRADPEEPRYLLLDIMSSLDRMRALAGSPAASVVQDKLYAAARKLAPLARTPAQRSYCAAVFTRTGHAAEALDLSEEAVKVDPSCDVCLGIHSMVLMMNRRPHEARAAMERAIAFMPDDRSPDEARKLLAELEAAMERASSSNGGAPGAPESKSPE